MKYLFLLFLTGCASSNYTGIVHEYVINQANNACVKHSGLHYIVSDMEYANDSEKSFPCREQFKFRCQDGTLYTFNDEIAFCFIPKGQLEESK